MKTKEILAQAFKVILDVEEKQVAELFDSEGSLTDTSLQTILDLDKARIKAIRDENATEITAATAKGYSKAQAEILDGKEAEIKKKYGVKSDKKLVDLIDEIIAEKSKGTPGQMTEDEIKRSKPYLDLQDKLTSTEETLKAERDAEVEKVKKEFQKKDTLKVVSKFIKEEVRKMNPVLPTNDKGEVDEVKADLQIQPIVDKLMAENDFSVDEANGKVRIVPLDKEQKPRVDGHNRRIEIAALVKTEAEARFTFRKAEPKKTPADPKNKGAHGSQGDGNDEKVYLKAGLDPAKTRDELSKGLSTINNDPKLTTAEKSKARVQYMDDSNAQMNSGNR